MYTVMDVSAMIMLFSPAGGRFVKLSVTKMHFQSFGKPVHKTVGSLSPLGSQFIKPWAPSVLQRVMEVSAIIVLSVLWEGR